MSYIVKRAYLYHKDGEEWNSTVDEDLSDEVVDLTVAKGVGGIKDSFSFNMQDASRFFSPVKRIVNDDLIKIWIQRDGSTFSDDYLFITGIINAINFSETTSEESITISGYDFSEVMFDFQIPPRYMNKTAPEIIRAILEEDPLKGRGITAGTIQEVKNDGSEFPIKNLAGTYTYVFELMEQLSGPDYTDDGQYYWYIDTDKKLHWKGKSTDTEDINIDAEEMDINSIKVSHKKADVKNFVVYNCGIDLEGNAVESVDYDEVSIAKVGFKYYYAVQETVKLFDELLRNEIEGYRTRGSLSTTWGSDIVNTTTGAWVSQQTFPTPNNSPLSGGNTYTWLTKKLEENGTQTTLTSESNSEFNDHAVELALQMGENVSQSIISFNSKPKYQLSVEIPFRSDLILGGLYPVNVPERGLNTNLRLMEFSIDLANMTLKFEQDVGDFEELG